jgi:leucyl aminopeptidase
MDITDFQSLGSIRGQSTKENKFPQEVVHKKEVVLLSKHLKKANIQKHLEYFTTFHNRFYNSSYGKSSSRWLINLINDTIKETGPDKYGVSVAPFEHAWDQHSIIVTIPGKCKSTVVVGAHQDSVNHADRMKGRAPGADDDGSGTMTILETLRVLLSSPDVLNGKVENTIEFH